MKKTLKHNRIVEDYLRNVNQSLDCAKDMKKALISEIEQQVTDLEEKIQDITLDDLYREIGTPEEIAQGFEDREDIDRIRKKAAKYKKIKWICLICSILAMITIVISIAVMCSSESFHSSTQVNSTVEEETK